MENDIQNIEFINQYLNKLLSANESEIFLNQLKTDSYFKNLYEEHLVFLEGLKRQTLKAEIKKARQHFVRAKWLKFGVVSVVIIAASIVAYVLITNHKEIETIPNETENSHIILDTIPAKKEVETIVLAEDSMPENHVEIIKQPRDSIGVKTQTKPITEEDFTKAPELFAINTLKDTILICKEGTKLIIKANSFVDSEGKPVQGTIDFQVAEYYKLSDMLLANLSTTSNDKQLETGGMLYIEAKHGNSELKLKENASIEIHFSTKPKKDSMQLFSGEWKDGVINWELQKNTSILKNEIEPITLIGQEPGSDDVEVPFSVIQQPPVYPGCENKNKTESRKCTSEALNTFVRNNFNTNIADALGLRGRLQVISFFKINEEGKIVSVESRGAHPALEAEADRVVGLIPKMQPGKQRDKAVTVRYNLPIIFQVDGLTGNASVMGGLPMATIPKADSIISNNFENSLTKDTSVRNRAANVNSYILRTLNLGWINCDRFINGRTERIKYSIKNLDGNKTVVSMVFKSINSVLPGKNMNGVYSFGTVGKNEDVVLIAIKKDNDKLYFDTIETKTQENPNIQFDFKEVTIEELKEELKKLNGLFI